MPFVRTSRGVTRTSRDSSCNSGQAQFEDKTTVATYGAGQILNLFHPAEAFARNVRAYVSTLLPALKCMMDVQSSDGNGLLLKYAASYVSKWHGRVRVRRDVLCESGSLRGSLSPPART